MICAICVICADLSRQLFPVGTRATLQPTIDELQASSTQLDAAKTRRSPITRVEGVEGVAGSMIARASTRYEHSVQGRRTGCGYSILPFARRALIHRE